MFLLLVSLLACGGQKNTPINNIQAISNPSDKQITSGLPKWVMDQPPLCGVGSMPLQQTYNDVGQAKALAEDAARQDLSRQLESKVSSMIQQYNSSTAANGEFVSETDRKNVSEALSKQTLNGSRPKKAEVKFEYLHRPLLEEEAGGKPSSSLAG